MPKSIAFPGVVFRAFWRAPLDKREEVPMVPGIVRPENGFRATERHCQVSCLRRVLLFVVLTLWLGHVGCSKDAVPENGDAGSLPTTTVLVYMEGTNLEDNDGQATKNVREMQKANTIPRVNVLLTTGAGLKTSLMDPVKSWQTLKRHQLVGGRITQVQDLGVQDMGKPAVLTDFIVWGCTRCPASRYVLVLWDHGGGSVLGFGGYASDGKDIALPMRVPDLRKGIADAVALTGVHFDIIDFDACLMANLETASNLAPFARFLVASQEFEPGGGQNYTPFFNALSLGVDTSTVCKVIVDAYRAKCGAANVTGDTLSVTDLSEVRGVVDAVERLGQIANSRIRADPVDALVLLGSARKFTEEYGAAFALGTFYNMADLGSLATQLKLVDPDTYGTVSDEITAALTRAVYYKANGHGHPNATGLSIYFPFHDRKTYVTARERDLPIYQTVDFSPAYKTMITSYVTYPHDHAPTLTIHDIDWTDPVMSSGFESTYGISEVYVDIVQPVAATTRYRKIGQDLVSVSENNTLTYDARDRMWFTLDGHPVIVQFDNIYNGLDSYVLAVPIYVRDRGVDTQATLEYRYDRRTNQATFLMAWRNDSNESLGKTELVLLAGDLITPIVQEYDRNTPGQYELVKGTSFLLTTNTPELVRARMPHGTYSYAFEIMDLFGYLARSRPIELTVE